jgi:hypothetical protein
VRKLLDIGIVVKRGIDPKVRAFQPERDIALRESDLEAEMGG